MKSSKSPFKKFVHSRESSQDNTHKRTPSGTHTHSRNASGSAAPPVSGTTNPGHKRSTSRSSNSSQTSNFLAEQYERDRKAIIKYCFSKVDPKTGVPPNNYITHVRIIEDSKSPSARPPVDSKLEYKKKRVLIVSSKASNTKEVQLHKARENSDTSFQIGRTWDLKELVKIEADSQVSEGFTLTMGKVYYWETNSSKERAVFIKSLVSLYLQTFEGKVPELVNWDLSLFYLDEKSYNRAVINRSPSLSLPSSPLKTSMNTTPSHSTHAFPQGKSTSNHSSIPIAQGPPQAKLSGNSSTALQGTAADMTKSVTAGVAGAAVVAGASNMIPPKNRARQTIVPPIDTSAANIPTREPPMRSPNRQSARLSTEGGLLNRSPYANSATINDVNRTFHTPPEGSIQSRSPKRTEYGRGVMEERYKPIRNEPPKENDREMENKFMLPSETKWSTPENQTLPTNSKEVTPGLPPAQEIEEQDFDSFKHQRDEQMGNARTELPKERVNDHLLEDLNAVLRDEDYQNAPQPVYENEEFNNSVVSDDLVAPLNIADVAPLDTGSVEAFGNRLDDPIDLNAPPSDIEESSPVMAEVSETLDSFMDDTKEDTTEMSFEKNDEVRYSQGFAAPVPHVYHEVSTIQEEPAISKIPDRNEKRINKSNDSLTLSADVDDEALLEILTDVNWDIENDDADTLLEKISNNLNHTEYTFNKNLLSLNDLSPSLAPYEENIGTACDKINPTFSLFLMEMSNCSEDIDYVESQHNGLQIESANKKQLWSTLDNLLKIVSLDEDTLNKLLNCPIREKNLPWIEEQLESMWKAFNAIEGEKNKEEANLRDMEALRQRREFYEKVTKLLIQRMVEELGNKFSSLHNSSTTSEQFVNILNNLLVFSPIVLFCKIMSLDSYNKLVELWNANAQILHKTIWDKELIRLERKELLSLKSSQETLIEQGSRQLMTQWQQFKKTRKTTTDEPIYGNFLVSILETMENLQKQCIYYQNFVDFFFHISSNENFSKAIRKTYSPEINQSLLSSVHCIESDREAAVRKLGIVSKAFQSVVAAIAHQLSEILKEESSIAPALMLYLEQKIRELETTNQEYLSSAFNRLLTQINQTWLEFLQENLIEMERSFTFSAVHEVSPLINGIAVYLKNIQDLFEYVQSQMNIEHTNKFETVSVVKNGCTTLALRVSKMLGRRGESASVISGKQENPDDIEMTIGLLVNSNSLVEYLAFLNNYMNGILDESLQQAKDVFDFEKEIYADYVLRETIPKLTSFVNGATNMLNTQQNVANPARWAAYSKQNLENILAGYSTNEIKNIIEKFHNKMIEQFSSDNEDHMEVILCDKLWSCLQGHTVSLYLKLQTLIDKLYPGTNVKFSKNDIISSFEKYRK
ncbi:Exocyst complex component SEC3 [Nakaseomyces bracarensis]|uniref:Exocyst complex component SEC3 n=1 Tax=Nakaseomyces bracarensis TaxID=273131 RepID=A0ABR4NSD9_9SACH